jgi:hypothetical protein
MPTPHRDSKGYYRLLQVETGATREQIQLAYERLEEMSPAQRGGGWSEITRAYSVLINPAARRAYDQVETQRLRVRRRPQVLNDVRLLVACVVLLVGILGFVWVPLYGSRLRSFSPGDALVTRHGSPFGTVVKTEERHTFPTGLSAPAYLVAVHGSGDLRWFPMNDVKASCRKAK